jgi:hypothetical protein
MVPTGLRLLVSGKKTVNIGGFCEAKGFLSINFDLIFNSLNNYVLLL